ncbi:phage tail protein [Desulfoluna spongiiphila]|uniref:Phage tail-collar fibre protein n=1 Tax=Desulfoluna spongiiphila TaxID=419481 RepID=A0A1G5ACS0_9BACT|nr:phage tail protein [Desulfoluna spongiiphila]SCX75686.1 Phage tail-collar fibre protein [Desulfoluna spongiiphila]
MTEFYTLWTDAGLQQIGASIAQDKKFTMPTAVVGDGGGTPVIPTKGMTRLKNLVWEGTISSITQSRTNANTFVYEFAVPADAGPFTVREVGLKDENGTLCIVGNFPDTQKPLIEDGSVRDMIIRIPVHVENADSVSLTVDPLVVASNGDVDRKIAVHNEHGEAHQDIREALAEKTAQATEGKRGTAAIATQDEVDEGISNTRFVTPKKLLCLLKNNYLGLDGGTATGLVKFSKGISIENAPLYSSKSLHSDYLYHDGTTSTWHFVSGSENAAGATGNGKIQGGEFRLGESTFLKPVDDVMRMVTPYGYVDLGPYNSNFCHFRTDREKFYFAKPVYVEGEIYAGSDCSQRVFLQGDEDAGPTKNKLVVRDGAGDIQCRLPRSTYQNGSAIKSNACVVMRNDNGSDNYHRSVTKEGFKAWLGLSTGTDKLLWSGSTKGTIRLSESINNFKAICILGRHNSGHYGTAIIPPSLYSNGRDLTIPITGTGNANDFIRVRKDNSMQLRVVAEAYSSGIIAVMGLK